MPRIHLALCGLALLAAACAGGNQPSSTPDPSAASLAPRGDPELITQSEIQAASLGELDGLAIVKQLRPRFLSFRGNVSASDTTGAGTVHVVIDNGRISGPNVLVTVRGREIQEIRYLGAAAATQHFGSLSKAGPVIMVRRI